VLLRSAAACFLPAAGARWERSQRKEAMRTVADGDLEGETLVQKEVLGVGV
jgi:hypothetical protein